MLSERGQSQETTHMDCMAGKDAWRKWGETTSMSFLSGVMKMF